MKYKIEKALQEQYENNRIRVTSIIGDAIIIYFEDVEEVHIIRVKKVATTPHSKKQVKCDGYVKELINFMNLEEESGEDKRALHNRNNEYIVVDGALYELRPVTSVYISTNKDSLLGGEFIC